MSLLSTSTNALIAFHRALNITGHNVANAKTEGYSRQRVSFVTQGSQRYPFGQIGQGARIAEIRRVVDQLATSRLQDNRSELTRLQQLSTLANRVDGLFSDKSTHISGAWSDFFDATHALAGNASGLPERQQFLDRAAALATRFRTLDHQLETLEQENNAQLSTALDEINRLSQEIATINGQVGGDLDNASPDLLDRRDQCVLQLLEWTGGTANVQADGQLNVVTAGGQCLVAGTTSATLVTTPDPYHADRLHLAVKTPAQTVTLEDSGFGGKLGGVFEFRHSMLDPARADLGRLAVGLAETVNTIHGQGMDLHGDLGQDVFKHATPSILAHENNTGHAIFSATHAALEALNGNAVELRFDGNQWSAFDADRGQRVALQGSGTTDAPFMLNGVELNLTGQAQAGDRFLLQPTSGLAGTVSVTLTDPARIAAAKPVKAEAGLDNLGQASVSTIHVDDVHHPELLVPARIEFVSEHQYTFNGEGPFEYMEGQPIAGNGWSLTLEGNPAAGDHFEIGPTGGQSSDNDNAKALGRLEHLNILDGQTRSLNATVAGLTAQVGSGARAAETAMQAQALIHKDALDAQAGISGVNMHEEAADMLSLQQAYQAASQLMATAETLFQTILNAVRR